MIRSISHHVCLFRPWYEHLDPSISVEGLIKNVTDYLEPRLGLEGSRRGNFIRFGGRNAPFPF